MSMLAASPWRALTVAQRQEARVDAIDAPPVCFASTEPCRYRRYWLERFTPREIHEMARWLPEDGFDDEPR